MWKGVDLGGEKPLKGEGEGRKGVVSEGREEEKGGMDTGHWKV